MTKKTLKKGLLIAIEGIDGSGKSTQAIRLCEYFREQGFNVSHFREPTDGPYGQKIRKLALHGRHALTPAEELELFIKDRIEDCRFNLQPALDRKELVFIDRYYFSSIAYQGALGIEVQEILQKNEEIAIIPDLVLIVDIAVKIGLKRIKHFRNADYTEFEKEDYLEKVREIFLKMKAPYIRVIDGSRDEDSVFHELINFVQDIIAPFEPINKKEHNITEAKDMKGLMTFTTDEQC